MAIDTMPLSLPESKKDFDYNHLIGEKTIQRIHQIILYLLSEDTDYSATTSWDRVYEFLVSDGYEYNDIIVIGLYYQQIWADYPYCS